MSESVVIDPIADAILERVDQVGATGFKWPPTDIAPVSGVIELPSIGRTGVDQREDHLGATDWTLTYPVNFYFVIGDPVATQALAVVTIESFILAIDADNGLGGKCQEAKVVEVTEPFYEGDQANAVLRWTARVEVLTFV